MELAVFAKWQWNTCKQCNCKLCCWVHNAHATIMNCTAF